MSYTEQTWVDGADGGTPITAARLDNIEDGIAAVDAKLVVVATEADIPAGLPANTIVMVTG